MTIATHPVKSEEIMAYIDGELSADRAEVVSTHIAECSDCHQIVDSFQSASRALANWTVPDASAALDRRIHSVRLEPGKKRVSASWTWKQWAGGVSAAALGVVVLLSLMTSNPARMDAKRAAAFARQRSTAVDLARTNSASEQEIQSIATLYDELSQSGTVGGSLGKLSAESRTFRGPMIARTVSLSIIAKDFDSSRAALDAILARHHAYAANLSANTQQNSARTLRASLRVPAAELAAVLGELKSLGHVESEAQHGDEVTQQHADLVARLKNSRETEARLQDILRTRTGKISDVLEVEQEIARVRGEIEQMEAERTTLEHRVDFASVDLKLSEEYKAQLGSPTPSISTRFHNARVAGFRDALETLVGIILFVAEYGPSLLIWLVLLFPPAWLVWRRWRRQYALASSM